MNVFQTGADATRGWVLYDGECRMCTGSARRFGPLLRRHRFGVAPLQDPSMSIRAGLKPGDPLTEMKLVAGGKVFGGAEALLEIARGIWWAWPLYALSRLPGAKGCLSKMYQEVAARRNCLSGACAIDAPKTFFISDWIPLMVLIIAALGYLACGPAWVATWALVAALVWGFKWAIWRQTARRFARATIARFVAFFCWPGMDADVFFGRCAMPVPVRGAEWVWATSKIVFGVAVTWGLARYFQPLPAGWIGMVGIVFVLHFGLFHLWALVYRRAGIAVEPIMRAPALAQSLGEFWGRRWNLAFNELAYRFGFAPLRRRLGVAGATLAVFGASGLIHELVISVPARGGYGLPTFYFTVQGLGLIFERTTLGRRLGLGRGWRGWLFTAACTTGPAFWLFHPPFIHNVVLPMLHAIGAT